MRAREFLLEYNREKTAQVFGKKLLAALVNDRLAHGDLSTYRAYIVQKQKIGAEIPAQTQQEVIDSIMQSLELADPTPNKQYVQWLAKVYANERVPLEDITSVGKDWLERYQAFKQARLLTGDFAKAANIMNLTFSALADLAHNNELLGALQSREEQTADRGDAEQVFENDQVRIIVPKDETAACYYGQGTRWCTAARNNNMFDRYASSGKLYILLPKKPQYEGEKYQLHFNSGQFMDEGDNQVDDPIELLTNRFGNLVDFFRTVEPEINDWLVFADDATLEPLIAKIKTAVMDRAWETISEWEVQDDYWYEWLRKEGYVYPEGHEDEGEIDYDRLTDNDIDYYSWNYDAQDHIRDHQDAVDINPDDVRRLANEIYHEWNEDILDISKLDDIFSYNLEQQFRKETEIGKWITENIWVKKTGTGWDVSLLGSTDPATGQRKEYPIR